MSYITPSSYIYVLEGVPFDETYQHSIYFANTADQYNYFSSKIKYRFNAQTYQRVKRGYCRVQQKADAMYGCNYMMFQNTNYSNKWFYAFILDVEYINDNVSEIHYEIDVLQSWLFRPASGSLEYDSKFQFNKCFVNREHTVTDNLWEHNVPEGLDVGEYKMSLAVDPDTVFMEGSNVGRVGICLASSVGLDNQGNIENKDGEYVSGIYSGVHYYYTTTVSSINALLNKITEAGKADAIVNVFMCPLALFTPGTGSSASDTAHLESYSINIPVTTIDGYMPHNKKLFSSPYQMLVVDTGTGCASYNWEYFNHSTSANTAIVNLEGSPANNGRYIIYPLGYKGVYQNYNESVIGQAGGNCPYSIDGYKAWFAQNQYILGAQEKVIANNYNTNEWMATHHAFQDILGLNGGQGGVSQSWQPYDISTVTPSTSPRADYDVAFESGYSKSFNLNPKTIGRATTNYIASQVQNKNQKTNATLMLEATKQTATIKPNLPAGSSVDSLMMAVGNYKPRFYNFHIRREFAEIIDGYFDRYGYAVHTFKIPTLNNRPHWTYLQTVDCTIRGNIPNDDSTRICAIFNSGITFWRNGNEVGNYSLTNTPT